METQPWDTYVPNKQPMMDRSTGTNLSQEVMTGVRSDAVSEMENQPADAKPMNPTPSQIVEKSETKNDLEALNQQGVDGKENEQELKPAKRIKKRLIIPPGCDVPITQKKLNIFDPAVCQKIPWEELQKNIPAKELEKKEHSAAKPMSSEEELMQKLTFANGKSALDVRGEMWITTSDLRERKKSAKRPLPNSLEQSADIEMPDKPSGWDDKQYLNPEVQCPPKKRGRKPKQDKEEQKTDKTAKNSSKGTRAKAASKPKEKQPKTSKKRGSTTPEEVKPESNEGKKPKGGKPSSEAPKARSKRKARSTDVEEAAESKPDAGDQDVDTPGSTGSPSERTRQHLQEAKKARLAEKEKTDAEKKEAEKKARYSRKSAAYHRAKKATKGTPEEKIAAAKKVS